MSNQYDLIIIGGGAGAFAAAIKANELKAITLMVNQGLPLGGTCVNVGCVPSKTLLWAGEVMHLAKSHNISGLDIEVKNFDFSKVIQHELDLVARLKEEKYQKVLSQLEYVTHVEGQATFTSSNEIEVNGQKYQAKKFIIAAGSTATVPPIGGIREVGFLTHIEALKLKQQPRELIVVGAGPVGLEFTQMYARFGTKVTILHRGLSIFRGEEELTTRLAKLLTNEGITIKTGVQVQSARKEGDKKVVSYLVEEKQEEVSADEILQSHIYSVGDITNGPLRLETTAGREGTLVAENALKGTQNSIDYNSVPWTIFTDPQLAGVGFTEKEQMKRFGTCMCKTVSFKDVPKALIINRTEGLIKMAIHPETKQIMGVHILSPNAGDLIAEAMVLIKNKNTIDDVVNSLPMFPTLSEAIKIAALSFTNDITKLSCCI
ncbi:FAD-dependent oxidoreductase [Candidatus Daviesbacteria bacterium]|nr:FAD-dependent oxidoreductase [Candidatus Daviesbacteria bacterium]